MNRASVVNVAIGMIVLLIGLTIVVPWVSDYDPYLANSGERLQAPSVDHLFGTDHLGRDVFTRLFEGARYSLFAAFIVVSVSTVIAFAVGIYAGMRKGWFDYLFMRISEWLLAIPTLILALIFIAILGPGLSNLVLSLSLVFWVPLARLIRNRVNQLMTEPFVHMARISRVSTFSIMKNHVLPFVFPYALVLATLEFGGVILHISGFSFLGIGIQAPTPELGAMLNESRSYLFTSPWLMIVPGVFIVLFVFSLNLIAEHIQDYTNQRRR